MESFLVCLDCLINVSCRYRHCNKLISKYPIHPLRIPKIHDPDDLNLGHYSELCFQGTRVKEQGMFSPDKHHTYFCLV
jgi:hypothetical protein